MSYEIKQLDTDSETSSKEMMQDDSITEYDYDIKTDEQSMTLSETDFELGKTDSDLLSAVTPTESSPPKDLETEETSDFAQVTIERNPDHVISNYNKQNDDDDDDEDEDIPSDLDYDSSDDEATDTDVTSVATIEDTFLLTPKRRKSHRNDQLKTPKVWYELESKYPKDCSSVVIVSQKDPKELKKMYGKRLVRKEITSKKANTDRGLYFRFSNKVIKSTCIRKVLLRAGFQLTNSGKYNIKWGLHMKPNGFRKLNKYQKFNHFPGSWGLGRKDSLHKNLSHMKRMHGPKHYDFFPQSWILPNDKKQLKKEMASHSNKMYIVKPKSSCCGRGIKVVRKYSEVRRKAAIVSEYISRPMTIHEAKFDLRLYVVMTSVDPLRIYLYDEGLCRISTHKYTTKKNSRFVHLTNYSVNKKSKHFIKPPDDTNSENLGHKWSLTGLRKYWKEQGVNDKPIWAAVHDLIIKTILSVEGKINLLVKKYIKCSENVCFELFGFDVLIDADGKPFILEVNNGPSLSSSSPMDKRIKTSLVSDIYQMVGVVPYERKKFKAEKEKEESQRLFTATSSSKPERRTLVELQKLDRLDKLTEEDRQVICETQCEYDRRGAFQRIFPTANTSVYNPFFSSIRYKNEILNKFLSESSSRRRALLNASPGKAPRRLFTRKKKPKVHAQLHHSTLKKKTLFKKTKTKQDRAMEKLSQGVCTQRRRYLRRKKPSKLRVATPSSEHLYRMDSTPSTPSFSPESDIFHEHELESTVQPNPRPRRSLSARRRPSPSLLSMDTSVTHVGNSKIIDLSTRFGSMKPQPYHPYKQHSFNFSMYGS